MPRRPDRPCSVCGTLMWRGTGALPDGEATCRSCRARRRPNRALVEFSRTLTKVRILDCGWCDSTFVTRQPSASFCSRLCKNRHRNSLRPGPVFGPPEPRVPAGCDYGPPEPKTCTVCFGAFPGSSARRLYCSDKCSYHKVAPRIMGLYRTATAELDIPKASMWRHRLCQYLAGRDGAHCHLCRRPVNLSLPSGPRGSELGPSIDHVVPRSVGGSDDLANLALAHWKCNRGKGVSPMGEQLRLVG